MKRSIAFVLFLVLSLLPSGMVNAHPSQQIGQPTILLTPAYSKVMNGANFNLQVGLSNLPWQGMHCVTVQVTATGGFSVLSTKQYISHLTSARTLNFVLRAPGYSSSGTLSVTVTWSQVYSCGGTLITSRASRSISSGAPWKLNVGISSFLCVPYADNAAVYTVISSPSWKYRTYAEARSPYTATVSLHPSSGSYYVNLAFPCLDPLTKDVRTLRRSKTVLVSYSGQTVTFP